MNVMQCDCNVLQVSKKATNQKLESNQQGLLTNRSRRKLALTSSNLQKLPMGFPMFDTCNYSKSLEHYILYFPFYDKKGFNFKLSERNLKLHPTQDH